jgi:protein disulfide-isomerase A6
MLHQSTLAAAAVLLAVSADASSLYAKNSPVLQVTGRSYDRLIAQSNHTSVR